MQELPCELLEAYTSLFVERSDQYAVQQRDGSYWRVSEPLTLSHLAAHLAGQWTLGSYVLDASSRCSFAVFDADGGDGLERLALLSEDLLRGGVPTLLEVSRRGGHLWVHLLEPTPAHLVRGWLLPYASALGVELYPKQDWLPPGGSGSLIRLPLGVHQQSRGWYPFLVCSSWEKLVPVGRTVEECCTWVCQQVHRVAVPASVIQVCSLSVAVQRERSRPVESRESVPMASRERRLRGEVPGGWGVVVRPYLSPVPRARNCWEAPGTFWVRGLGCGGEPGAVGTRGGVGAPPTAYQPHGRGASKLRPYTNKKGRSSVPLYQRWMFEFKEVMYVYG